MKTFTFLGITFVHPTSVHPIHQNEQRLMNTKKFLAGGAWTFEQVKLLERDLLEAEKGIN